MPTGPRSMPRRRSVLLGAAAWMLLMAGRTAAQQARLDPTPAQPEGPFYPLDWSGDVDSDLTAVAGRTGTAKGQVLLLAGRVLEATGRPMAGATVEIWQTDANGVYRHPGDDPGGRRRDAGFQGRGRTLTDADGRYSFRTVRPVLYSGRAPHIHFRIRAGARVLTTQMYLAGEPANARDGLLGAVRGERQRERLIVRLEPGEGGALAASFDIVLP